jgi:hypothetical protein
MSEFFACCGIRLGGQGGWEQLPPTTCKIVFVERGLTAALNALTPAVAGVWRVGLYKNDRTPRLADTAADYISCNFSGYSGEQLLYYFSPATMRGPRAYSQALPVKWTHNGGTVGNEVYGLYVKDLSGAIVVAERFCGGPFNLDRLGRFIRLTPELETLNEVEVS